MHVKLKNWANSAIKDFQLWYNKASAETDSGFSKGISTFPVSVPGYELMLSHCSFSRGALVWISLQDCCETCSPHTVQQIVPSCAVFAQLKEKHSE